MAMSGYTKLFSSILASTIWRADMPTRIVWITLLAMADKNGIAEGSIPGLADFARVSLKECENALIALSSPDTYSRSQEHGGRRIEPVDGGWHLLNHAKYRAKLGADERREYLKVKAREYRRKRRQPYTEVDKRSGTSTLSTHTEAEAEASTEAGKIKSESAPTALALRPQALADLWNAYGGTLPKCSKLTDARKRKAAQRLKDYTPEEWTAIIGRIAGSSFCNGENDRGWIATFDWLLQPDVATKVLEGKYDNRHAKVAGGKGHQVLEAGRRVMERMAAKERQ